MQGCIIFVLHEFSILYILGTQETALLCRLASTHLGFMHSFHSHSFTQGGIQMFIRVVDIDNASVRTLVDHFRLQEHLTPPASTPFKTYSGLRNNTTLVARFNVTCTENFYRPSCSTFCASQNDTWLGHYECAVNGEKVCRPGYTDPTSNCTKCATARGCCEF